jgi:hypothetical protein
MIYTVLSNLWSKSWFRYSSIAVASATIATGLTIVVYPSQEIKEEAAREARSYAEQEFKEALEQKHFESQESLKETTDKFNEEIIKQLQVSRDLQQKISELTVENTSLKSKRRVETIVTKDPSGKEETKIVDVTETESSSNKESQRVSELTEKFKQESLEKEQRMSEQLISERTKHDREISLVREELSKTKQSLETSERSSKTVISNPKKLGVGVGYTTDRNYSGEVSYQFWGSVYGQVSADSDFKKSRGRLTLGLRL